MNRISRRLLFTTLIAFSLALVACGGTIKPGEAKVDHPVVTGIRTGIVEVREVPNWVEAVGTVRSANTSMVATKVMGVVKGIRVREGDRVRAGQLLMVLDDRDVAAQLAKAQAGRVEVKQALAEVDQGIRGADANRQFANATYARFKNLYEKKSVSPQEFDEVEAKYKGADAMYQSMLAKREQVLAKDKQVSADIFLANTFVSYTRITSPQDGIVTQKLVDVGTMAAPGMPLIVIEDARRYRLEANVGEESASTLHLGDEVMVDLPSINARPFHARITELVPVADPMTRTSTIKVDLPFAPALRSGLYGSVRFAQGTKKGLFLPKQALRQRGELDYIMIVGGDGIAQMRLVKTAPADDGQVEILSGLVPVERVVLDGVDRVVDGAKVQ